MEFAEEVLIFGTGFNAPPEQIQVSSSRSNLFRHHAFVDLRNLWKVNTIRAQTV